MPAAVREGRHHGLVLGAAGLAVLLAATVLAALATLSERAVEGGIQRRLAADRDAVVEVAVPREAGLGAGVDRSVRAVFDRTYGRVPHHTWAALRAPAARNSELFVTGQDGRPREDMTVSVVAVQGAGRHAVLTAGRWPRAGAGRGEAVLPEALAAELGVRPGGRFSVRGAGDRLVRLDVVGLYATRGRAPAVWASLSSTSGLPDTVVLVSREAFAREAGLGADSVALWLGVPDARGVRLGDIGALRERAQRFGRGAVGVHVGAEGVRGSGARADARTRRPGVGVSGLVSASVSTGGDCCRERVAAGGPPEVTVSGGLRRALGRLGAPIAVARAGLYVPGALLGALACAALVLTARQLAEHRRPELALLAARGAGTRRLALATAAQWACVAVPAGCAAPFLAGPLLRGLHGAGLLSGDVPASAATGVGWTAALIAVVVHGVAVLVPTVLAVRERRAVAKLRLRVARFAGAQRFGADLALGAVAVLGWLQLRQYRSPVTGGDGVDPVLVLAPVAMTVAAALLALRCLPLAARLVDPLARRGRGFVLPLGGWQLGRRAARHAGPALVVTLALAVAALSSTALAILDRGDRDQAAFQVGADVRIEPGDGTPPQQRRAAYEALPGAEAVTPVVTSDAYIGQEAVTVTAVNTARGPLPSLRGDLADRPVRDLVAPLGAGVPAHGIAVAGAGGGAERELPLRVRMSAGGSGQPRPVRLTVFFEDGDGLTRSSAVLIEEGGARTVPLKVPVRGDVRIVQLELSMVGERHRRTYRLTVDQVPGLARPAGWRDLRQDAPDRYVAGCPGAERERRGSGEAPGPVLCRDRPGAGKLLDAVLRGPDGDLRYPTWAVRLGTDGTGTRPAKAAPAPALAADALLDSGAVRVGDTVTVRRGVGGSARVRIVGRIAAVPGEPRDRARLFADSRAMAAQWALSGSLTGAESAWWVGVKGTETGPATAAVRERPGLGRAVDVAHARAELAADPLRRGARGALTLCLLLAPAFAVIAFTLHTVLSARARAREFALLRALGVRKGQLAAYLWTEQLGLAGAAAVLGTLLGAGLAVLIMPVVTVDASGAPVFPGLLTSVPWVRVTLTAGATALVICAVVSVAARFLGRVDLARVLRAGEDV
ncbi:ABC transporter permease [Streptomyces kanamyceticus]|uniref:ABC transporter permease n=3 Tax=Streptomyces kanamyceticus TaxID=1967 RepID=A0A5J6GDP0_STRKN|nr:ABC transporter permease [Streptomyces kanamyceticus]